MFDDMEQSEADVRMRRALADVAYREARLRLSDDGPTGLHAVEKYLATLRPALAAREKTRHLAASGARYDWCGAFVYFCCKQAGYTFAGQPQADLPGTLAAVMIWRMWAERDDMWISTSDVSEPVAGDIVVFDRLLEPVESDHIGIVLSVEEKMITTAEGNVEHRARVFERRRWERISGYIRLAGTDKLQAAQHGL